MEYIFGIDNYQIDEKNNFDLSSKDFRYSPSRDCEVYSFVGFIIQNNRMLTIFPKNFYSVDEESKIEDVENILVNDKDKNFKIELLFKVINKYIQINKAKLNKDKYFRQMLNYSSDYPFAAFYQIYDYYKRYGIYKNTNYEFNTNLSGNIVWKKTIQKSNILISNSNIIFLPLIAKNQNYTKTFIGECMIFAINYTIKNFPFFIKERAISGENQEFNFIDNINVVINRLHYEEKKLFKDNQKKLVKNLIDFFEQFRNKAKGGGWIFKVRDFSLIWEDMIEKYLNDFFEDITDENNKYKLKFDSNKKNKETFIKGTYIIDKSSHKYEIQPDHMLEKNNKIYIFDSKYYSKLHALNYKQFAYTILFGNRPNEFNGPNEIYSVLVLPGNKKSKFHLELNDEFSQQNKYSNKIIECYLDVESVMKNYINQKIDINSEIIADDNGIEDDEYLKDHKEKEPYLSDDNEDYKY